MSLLRRTVVVSNNIEVQHLAQGICQELFVADDLSEALEIVERIQPNLLVIDTKLSPVQIREFLDTADNNSIEIPVVVVGIEDCEADHSTEFMQIGALDYLSGKKEYYRLTEIANSLRNKIKSNYPIKNASDFFIDDFAASMSIAGRSKAIQEALKIIRLIAESQCNPVLVVGETGTGKELAAKAIHALRHPQQPFVAVNCAALTANLLESELFGHVKGSFTGADREKIGLFELAGSGTILLDEISEMSLDLQAKLLRVLQEKTFRKVGGTTSIECKATIIASSNRNLKNEVQANQFRKDLYYRLGVYPINIPPLRSSQRKDDIALLAEYLLKTSTIYPKKRERIICLTNLAIEALQRHEWPGNVRELRNVIERAILIEMTDKIGIDSILLDSTEFDQPTKRPTSQFKDFSLEKAERELIARALQETGWQKTQAATLLGITRATLYAKVKQYNIQKQVDNSNGSCKKLSTAPLPEPSVAN